ncbi:MAG: tetratricopeptide repeat protein [Proteobacteria bacterium]|nr:tetratricopeptide repeat protein [Pseudomonadota bacterium]MBU1739179.1 tetratricopeptide repeat protein [Pseudomonadota bacterium]
MNERLRTYSWYFSLAVVVVLVFGRTVGFDFVSYDDTIHVYENHYVRNFSARNLLYFWQQPHEKLYIPLVYNLWAVLAWCSGILFPSGGGEPNPHLYHAANVLCHLLNTFLVFSLLKKLLHDPWGGLAGALLFALHPVQAEAVSWVSGMKDLLSGLFFLLALNQYVRCLEKDPEARLPVSSYMLATLFFLLALFSKPSVVVLPVVAAVIARCFYHRSLRRLIPELGPWVALAVPIITMTRSIQVGGGTMAEVSLAHRLLVAGDACSFYLWKLFWPLGLTFDYGRSLEYVLAQGWVYLTGIIPVLAALVIWRFRRPWLLAAAGIFISLILPVSGLVPFPFQMMSTVADRYLYLAILGPALAAGWAFSRYRQKKPVLIVAVLIPVLLGAGTVVQKSHWRNSDALYENSLKINSRSWMSLHNLGALAQIRGQYNEAMAYYEKALAVKPDSPIAWSIYRDIGSLYRITGEYEKSIAAYRKSLDFWPEAPAYYGLGQTYLAMGDPAAAIPVLIRAVEKDPRMLDAYHALASAYYSVGRRGEAQSIVARSLAIAPGQAELHAILGNIYSDVGQDRQAIAEYQRALALNPRLGDAHAALGFVWFRQQDTARARKAFKKATEVSPESGSGWNGLGMMAYQQGNLLEALDAFLQAIKVDPDDGLLYNNVSRVYFELGRYDLAVSYFDQAVARGVVDPVQRQAVEPYR